MVEFLMACPLNRTESFPSHNLPEVVSCGEVLSIISFTLFKLSLVASPLGCYFGVEEGVGVG